MGEKDSRRENLFVFLMFYLFLRQKVTEHEQGRGREIEEDTGSEADSRL